MLAYLESFSLVALPRAQISTFLPLGSQSGRKSGSDSMAYWALARDFGQKDNVEIRLGPCRAMFCYIYFQTSYSYDFQTWNIFTHAYPFWILESELSNFKTEVICSHAHAICYVNSQTTRRSCNAHILATSITRLDRSLRYATYDQIAITKTPLLPYHRFGGWDYYYTSYLLFD